MQKWTTSLKLGYKVVRGRLSDRGLIFVKISAYCSWGSPESRDTMHVNPACESNSIKSTYMTAEIIKTPSATWSTRRHFSFIGHSKNVLDFTVTF